MQSQNTNYNSAGRISCCLLLLLAFLAINPITSSSVNALEGDNGGEGTNEANHDNQIATTADTPSTVGISFSPASGSASLSPTTSAGQSAQVNVLATVNVQNSGGYSVYLKSSSVNLVGAKNSNNIIPGSTTAKTYANMDANTWGYYANEGTEIPNTATYKAVSVSGNGDKIAENTTKKITSDSKKIMLSFATKINDQKPADTYKNTITMSVVSSPLQTTIEDITNMQDMTSSICSASPTYETKQLRDTRDGKFYWVSKLADGKCWMTQNLDFDLSTSTALTPTTSDVSNNWTPRYTTATTASSSTILDSETGQRSWSLGNYRITNPDESSNCGQGKNSAANCPSQFTAYTTPTSANGDPLAHYILGNHYQWNAATAGTGGAITSGQATSSICPKGWKLPTSNSGGEFSTLVVSLGGASSTNNITKAPFYGARGGLIAQATSNLFLRGGDYGHYWSSTPSETYTSMAYLFFFYNTTHVSGASTGGRSDGRSVRCIAR